MPKLHLKRTPEEEALHELRKKEKREGKRRRRHHESHHGLEPESSYSRKRRRDDQEPERKWASSDEDEEQQYGPQPAGPSNSYASRSHKPDRDQLRAEIDELRFREKLFGAFAEDERLDSLEARMNDFAHVPDRWRTARRPGNNFEENDEWLQTDPNVMDEEEYTEWIRMGMYRKTHAKEHAEEQRRKAAQAARRAEEKARREETARLEKAAEEERRRQRGERSQRLCAQARETYQKEWQELSGAGAEMMEFCDIPWPIFRPAKHRSAVSVDDLTAEAISAFLLARDAGEGERSRKEVLRETFLRFHPDKFEGRVMGRVRESEQDAVRQGIGRVVVVLNGLMAEQKNNI